MYFVLGFLGLLLLAYAGGLFWTVRRGKTIGRSAYLVLLLINVAILGTVVAWFVSRSATT